MIIKKMKDRMMIYDGDDDNDVVVVDDDDDDEDEVDATPNTVAYCGCAKCGSSSKEFHNRRSQVISRRFQRGTRYPNVGPVLEVIERFLASSHGFETQRGHSTVKTPP